MTQIDHLERKRDIRLEVTPPEDMALQSAAVGGNTDKLTETRLVLQWNFVLAFLIGFEKPRRELDEA